MFYSSYVIWCSDFTSQGKDMFRVWFVSLLVAEPSGHPYWWYCILLNVKTLVINVVRSLLPTGNGSL